MLELFDVWAGRDSGIIQLWREHEAFLRTTATQWGWQPRYTTPDGRQLFFGEYCALSQADQAACADARYGDDDDA